MNIQSAIPRLLFALMLLASLEAFCLELDVSAQKYRARPGEAYPVDYVVSWVGEVDAYAVLPLTPPHVDWGRAELLETRTRSAGDRHEVRLTIGYYGDTSGDFEAPGLSVRVAEWDAASSDAVATLDEAAPIQVLEAGPVTVRVRTPRTVHWLAGAFVILATTLALSYAHLRRRSAASDAPEPTPVEQAQELLHGARKHRLDGDFYHCYRALHRALELVAAEDADANVSTLRDRIQQRMDDTGYRGKRPSDDELAGDFKDVEHSITLFSRRVSKES